MARRVRDFIEISDYTSLDALINILTAVRDHLPADAEPELQMRGDDVFGRRLTISYLRELTAEEAKCQARYTGAVISEPDPQIEELREKLEKIAFARNGEADADDLARRRIRRVA